jgi:hypothetical protein
MPPSHPTSPNNQSLSLKLGKALLVIVEASSYPNALTRIHYRDFQVGSFHTCSLFYLPSNECWIVLVPSPSALLLVYLLPSVFVNEAPSALVAKTKKQPITGAEGGTVKGPSFLPHLEVRCLRLKTSSSRPCHIIHQLGSGLDSVNGVNAVFLEPTFRLS